MDQLVPFSEFANSALLEQFPTSELIVRAPGEQFLRARVDTRDVPTIFAASRYWRALWSEDSQTFYVRGHLRGSGKRGTTIHLHRVITAAPPGMTVDHRDHDGLNN